MFASAPLRINFEFRSEIRWYLPPWSNGWTVCISNVVMISMYFYIFHWSKKSIFSIFSRSLRNKFNRKYRTYITVVGLCAITGGNSIVFDQTDIHGASNDGFLHLFVYCSSSRNLPLKVKFAISLAGHIIHRDTTQTCTLRSGRLRRDLRRVLRKGPSPPHLKTGTQ